MFVVKHRTIFFAISIILVLGSIFSVFYYGLNLGTDFKGGSVLEVAYQAPIPARVDIDNAIKSLNLGSVNIQPVGSNGYSFRMREINDAEHQGLLNALSLGGTKQVEERSFSFLGATLGHELAQRGIIAILIAVLLIIIFIAFAFRKVSREVRSWKYGVIAVIALLHDVTIPTGAAAILGHYQGFEIDALFLTAIMTIFALSVNDTIVIFDRIRENVRHHMGKSFEETVGRSLSETYVRSFNTSFTVILVLLSLYFFGGESTRNFSLILTIGMIIGTYSSIFLAAPLLVVLEKGNKKK